MSSVKVFHLLSSFVSYDPLQPLRSYRLFCYPRRVGKQDELLYALCILPKRGELDSESLDERNDLKVN